VIICNYPDPIHFELRRENIVAYAYECMHVKGLAALRLALVEEAIFSGHFSHVTRSPTLAGVALVSNVLRLRRDGHVVLEWPDFVAAAATHDRQLLDNEDVVDAETTLLHTVVRLLSFYYLLSIADIGDHDPTPILNSLMCLYAMNLNTNNN